MHALDAKVSLDNNAAFRHPEWDEFRATEELDEREQLATTKGLQYIGLDGTVGIIANGAGLAMCTLDVVNQVGGTPANFLDIGGGANADVMAAALEVINFDENVQSDLHQHLRWHHARRGGRQGDRARRSTGSSLRAPIVIRLDGTNAERGPRRSSPTPASESKLTSQAHHARSGRARPVALANGSN